MSNSVAQEGFRTYIGLRYVPKIIGVWDNSIEYEALSIVVYEGNSYTSKKPVPIGVQLDNTEFWVMTGNYNVQVANLQNEVEVAVRQILDYATDFEKFKNDMNKLFEDFVVDANGQVLAKVEEYEHLIGEQYKEFIKYVNNALQDFRSEMDTFTSDTTQRIEDFINSSNTRIDTKFTEYETKINKEIDDYELTNSQKVTSLQTQVDNLVLQAGNPEASSAEIVQARGGYATLNIRLNGLINRYLGFQYIPIRPDQAGNFTYDLNMYIHMGIWQIFANMSSNNKIDNTPYGDNFYSEYSPILIVYDFGNTATSTINSPYQYYAPDRPQRAYCKQILNIYHENSWHTFERYYVDGVFSEWKELADTNSTMRFIETTTIYDFNDTSLANTCCLCRGYQETMEPANMPDIMPDTPYVLETFSISSTRCSQIVYTGTNRRVFVRNKIGGTWTSWDYLATSDDVESAMASTSANVIAKTLEFVNTTVPISNFNTSVPFNKCYMSEGYAEGEQPNHSPDFPAETPFTLTRFGNINNDNQLFTNDGDDKFYIRKKMNNSWTPWDYVLTGKNIGNAHVLNDLETISSISDFNDLETDFDFNVGVIGSGILPDISASRQCYIYNNKNGNNVYQLIVDCETGQSYVRYYNGSAWANFAKAYDTSAFKNYNTWDGSGISLTALNTQIVNTPNYFTEKIVKIKFDSDITGDTNPAYDDRKGYLFTEAYGDYINQVFITSTGRTFHRNYYTVAGTWSAFASPYYTKSEIDTMLQNI